MKLYEFIQSKRANWERLDHLLHLVQRGRYSSLTPQELLELGRLYREATSDLARVQAAESYLDREDELVLYLNNLVARAHSQIYRKEKTRIASLLEFYRSKFPAAFRATLSYHLCALILFLLPALYGFVTTILDDRLSHLIVPKAIIDSIREGKVWFNSINAIRPVASSMIMTNNISVTFAAFALGITFGLGTVYIMAFNGLLFGTISGLCYQENMNIDFWSFVLPHGVIELAAIFIAGGAGLLIGSSLIFPGVHTRKDNLVLNGKKAIQIVVGCIPLLVAAGIIEAFISPSALHPFAKLGFAGAFALGLFSYLFASRPPS